MPPKILEILFGLFLWFSSFSLGISVKSKQLGGWGRGGGGMERSFAARRKLWTAKAKT
jgi:hypothetical protein